MTTEPVQNDNSKDITKFIEEYEALIKISQEAATAVLSVSEAAKIPDSVIETINLASEAYKMATQGAETLASVSTNSLGIVVAAATAATTALASLFDKLSEDLIKQNQLDETTQAIYNQTAAFKENVKAAEKNMQSIEKQTNAAKLYWQEIEKLVDKNGKAKGSTEELQRAVDRFNEVSVQSVTVIGDEIQGFNQLSITMGNNIEISRITAQMSYLQDSYAEALINLKDFQEQLTEAENNAELAENDYLSKKDTYEKVSAKWRSYEATDDELHEAKWPYEEAQKVWEEATEKATALKLQNATFQSAVDRYEELARELENINISLQVEIDEPQANDPIITDEFISGAGNLTDIFTNPDIASDIAAIVRAEISANTPAAAYASQANNYSSESESVGCCKIDIDKILEGLNKPINVVINEEVIGEAVLRYEAQNSQMTGT